jgi:hypothetical protein
MGHDNNIFEHTRARARTHTNTDRRTDGRPGRGEELTFWADNATIGVEEGCCMNTNSYDDVLRV